MYFRQANIGGILNITTKNPGKIKNRISLQFRVVRPLGYQKPKRFYTPKYNPDDELANRNGATLQWYPSVDISKSLNLSLPEGISPTDITVTVEGITPNGTTVEASQK